MRPHGLPAPAGIELWLVEGTGSDSERSGLQDLLSEDERARAMGFKVEDARVSFVVSRGVLRSILGDALSCAPESIRNRVTDHYDPVYSIRLLDW